MGTFIGGIRAAVSPHIVFLIWMSWIEMRDARHLLCPARSRRPTGRVSVGGSVEAWSKGGGAAELFPTRLIQPNRGMTKVKRRCRVVGIWHLTVGRRQVEEQGSMIRGRYCSSLLSLYDVLTVKGEAWIISRDFLLV